MIKKFGKTDEMEIEKLENEIRLDLPNDFKEFLVNNNGGSTGNDIMVFYVDKIKEYIVLDVLYGIGLKKGLNIIDWYHEYRDELLEGMVIIGHAVETGLILLINHIDWTGIYFWDNCLDYEDSREDDCLYKIADNFDKFIHKLIEE